jgi:3-methyl-2-oxobutanoate hydroxymethyltransferase
MSKQPEPSGRSKLTAVDIANAKGSRPLTMLALYDAQMARLAEESGIDLLLVGDSMGMVVLGLESTAQVTIDEILHHTQAVRRGAPHTHVVADLPFMTYQVSDEQAVASAGRLVKEGGADSVKLEGGEAMVSRIAAIARIGIPVIAHIGLLPQTAAAQSGFKVQGREIAAAKQLLRDAKAVAEAGAIAVVVELVPSDLAERITKLVAVPTIGIGAGVHCDGQVLVANDMLGADDRFKPRFLKTYADLAGTIRSAFSAYAEDVRTHVYPTPKHSFGLPEETSAALDAGDDSA